MKSHKNKIPKPFWSRRSKNYIQTFAIETNKIANINRNSNNIQSVTIAPEIENRKNVVSSGSQHYLSSSFTVAVW